jgi:hypothetical protein
MTSYATKSTPRYLADEIGDIGLNRFVILHVLEICILIGLSGELAAQFGAPFWLVLRHGGY